MAETNLNPEQGPKKRRTKRIVQAVPLTVTGVDALGRPFQERTSTLTINCQGCRYQSKHYVLKNMWVTLEIPHNDAGHAPRSVRARVTWIQRPRTVRELFQIAVELEISGNVWGVAFPPSDWFPFPEAGPSLSVPAPEQPPEVANAEPEKRVWAEEEEPSAHDSEAAEPVQDNVRVISIAPSKDDSQQLSQQVERLVNEAKQEIQSVARQSANEAVAAETRMLLTDLHAQVIEAAKKSAAEAVEEQLAASQREGASRGQVDREATLASLREEMARELSRQVSEARQHMDAQLAEVERVRQEEFEQRIQHQLQSALQKAESVTRALLASENEARVAMEQMRLSSEQAATNELRLWQEQMDQRSADAQARLAQMDQAARGLREQIAAAEAIGVSGWRGALEGELEAATARWRERSDTLVEETARLTADKFAKGAESAVQQVEKQIEQRLAAIGEAQSRAGAEMDDALSMLRAAVNQEIARGEGVFSQMQQSAAQLEATRREISKELEAASEGLAKRGQAITETQTAELKHQAESLVSGMADQFRSTLEASGRKTVDDLVTELNQRLAPHMARVEESATKLAFDSEQAEKALADHQARVWQASDVNLQNTVSRGKELLAQIETEFADSARDAVGRWVNELESKATETTQSTFEALYKSADWYEKKVQNQMQTTLQKGVDQAAAQLREKAAELSGMFARELDHCSRSYVEHAQGQIQENAAEASERVAHQIAEAGDTASARFHERTEQVVLEQLSEYDTRAKAAYEQNAAHMESSAAQVRSQLESDARAFAVEFQRALSQHVKQTLAQGIQEMASQIDESREGLHNEFQALVRQFRTSLEPLGTAAIDEHKKRLDNASNAWLLTTVTKLTQQSEARIEELAEATEKKLRAVCSQVISEMGATLRQRLGGLAAPVPPPGAQPANDPSKDTK